MVLLAGGCFESGSDADPDTDTDTDSPDGSGTTPDDSGDPTGDEPTTNPTADDSTDDTTPGDDPPTIDAFTVAGSTRPSELEDSDRVVLAAEVSDDQGIDRVEFYQGETLVGTATEAPYEARVLLTSLDNGSHDFSARAFDSAAQRTDSEVVTLSVAIDGGSQVAILENLFEAGLLIIYPSIGVAIADDGDVVLTGPVNYEVDEISGSAILAQRWDPDLGEQRWVTQTQDTVGEGTSLHYPYGQPAIDDEGFVIVGGISGGQSVTDGPAALYRIGDEPFGEPIMVLPDVEPETAITPFAGIARGLDAEIYFGAPAEHVTRFTPDLGDEVWREPVLPTSGNSIAAIRIFTDSEGAPVVDAFVCTAESCSFTVRKLDPEDGGIAWTESSPYPSTGADGIGVGATAAGPNGRLATFVSRPIGLGGEVDIIVRDADGDTISEAVLTPEDAIAYLVTDAAYDAQGYLVVTGSVVLDGSTPDDNDVYQAWVARVAEDGTIVWDRRFEFYSAEATYGFGGGIEVDDRGRIYMGGVRDAQGGFLTLVGQAMLVQLNP